MRVQPITPITSLILCDADTTIPIPAGPPGGQPIALDYQFIVIDNLGTASSHNIALSGPIGGGTSGTSITTAYGSTNLRWDGNTWIQK